MQAAGQGYNAFLAFVSGQKRIAFLLVGVTLFLRRFGLVLFCISFLATASGQSRFIFGQQRFAAGQRVLHALDKRSAVHVDALAMQARAQFMPMA